MTDPATDPLTPSFHAARRPGDPAIVMATSGEVVTYRDLEDQGYLLVLTRLEVRFRRPVRYDDLLTVRTVVVRTTAVRIDHRYEVLREGELMAEVVAARRHAVGIAGGDSHDP